MFRRVFAKYIITFMALLTVSFLLLLFIVNSVVSNGAERARQQSMADLASVCAENLADLRRENLAEELGELFSKQGAYHRQAERLLTALADGYEGMTVYVTDVDGGFIFSTDPTAERIPQEEEPPPSPDEYAFSAGRDAWLRDSDVTEAETADGLSGHFFRDGYAYRIPVADEDGHALGYVLILSIPDVQNETLNDTLQSMIAAALWVMVAALIAIYFITERIVSPLREMSKAAKRMAVGKFDTRVPVHGRDEVAELAVAFNQMAGDLENLERMRNSFVANVSHDLRTPMTTISGFIDGILDGVIPPEQERHYLQVVSEEVRRLSRLVTALLDVSRLQAGDRKFDFRPFDICEMGRLILISFEKKIDEKELDVEFECDEERMFVLADQDAIHQILYNICDNAVKFSSKRGKLKVSFTWSPAEGSRHRKAVVKVYNEGQGIPAEDLPFIFERFYKSDKSRSLDKSGVGLGMYISKAIIDAHGETISVASEYGRYCQFTFTLTRADPPAPKERVGSA